MNPNDSVDPSSGYKLESLVAEGTRGRVYLATDKIGQKVAIKFLQESEFPENDLAQKHISHESRCLSIGAHEGIVKLIETGTNTNGRPYLVMEYIPGQTLKSLMNSGELDPQAVINWFTQLTFPIENLHKVGLIHLDLRPDKIILVPSGKELRPKLIGFGRAGLLPWAGKEQIVEPPGKNGLYSLQYISPEQAMEKRCLATSEVYSLACVMYEALTGQPPFKGENELHMMAQHLGSQAAPLVSSIKGEKYKKYDDLLSQALAKEAHRRFVDFAELREFLQSLAPPAKSGGWMSKFFKK